MPTNGKLVHETERLGETGEGRGSAIQLRWVRAYGSPLTWNGRLVCDAELQSGDGGISNYKVVSDPRARDACAVDILVAEPSRNVFVGLGRTWCVYVAISVAGFAQAVYAPYIFLSSDNRLDSVGRRSNLQH